MGDSKIIWTKVDEAPALASFSLLPVLKAYTRETGTKSNGSTQFNAEEFKEYFIGAGYQVQDANERVYQTTQDWTVRTGAVADPATNVELITLSAEDNIYFFVLPMEALEEGTEFDVQEDAAFTEVSQHLAGIVSISAYTSFTGGTAEESVVDAIANLENSLSHRAFESQTSINAKLHINYLKQILIIWRKPQKPL